MKYIEMTTIELKSNFHKLIDEINNDSVLNRFYEILSTTKDIKEGVLWSNLSINEQNELIETEKESYDENNLISHSDMILKNKKWL